MNAYAAVLTQLTARDLKLLQKLNLAGWLTTKQIQAYFFPGKSLNAVSKRLRKLVAAGYLADAQVSSTEMKYYRLAGRGHRVLLQQTEATDVISNPAQMPHKQRHFTAVNDLRIAFELAFPTPAMSLEYFHAEREYPLVGRRSHNPGHLLLQLLAGQRLIPDALAGLRVVGHYYDVALEYDGGTEPAHFFGRTKMRQYLDCFASYSGTFDEFKILIVAPTLKRLLSLMRQTALVQPPSRRFFFATLDKFQAPSWVTAPIFLDPTDYFVALRESAHLRVVEHSHPAGALPRHTLEMALTISLPHLGREQNLHRDSQSIICTPA